MTKVFTPYEGWEEDLGALAIGLQCPSPCGHPTCILARRLYAALSGPTCGKCLRWRPGADAGPVGYWDANGFPRRVACTLPAGHDGPHVPDVPEEAWR